jgi:hypothetical protein
MVVSVAERRLGLCRCCSSCAILAIVMVRYLPHLIDWKSICRYQWTTSLLVDWNSVSRLSTVVDSVTNATTGEHVHLFDLGLEGGQPSLLFRQSKQPGLLTLLYRSLAILPVGPLSLLQLSKGQQAIKHVSSHTPISIACWFSRVTVVHILPILST